MEPRCKSDIPPAISNETFVEQGSGKFLLTRAWNFSEVKIYLMSADASAGNRSLLPPLLGDAFLLTQEI